MRKALIVFFLFVGALAVQPASAADTLIASGSVKSNDSSVTAGWVELYGNGLYAGAEISNGQYSIYHPSDQTWSNGAYTLRVIPDTAAYPQNQAGSTSVNFTGAVINQNLTLSSAVKQIAVTVLNEDGSAAAVTVRAKASGGGSGMSFTNTTNSNGQVTFTVRPEGVPYHISVDNCNAQNDGSQDCGAWIYTGDPVTVSFAQADDQSETQTVTIQGETPSATITGNISYEGVGFQGDIHLYNADHLFSGWMDSDGNFTVYALPGAYKVDLLPQMSQTNPDIVRYYIDDATIGGAITAVAGANDIGHLDASYESSTVYATITDDSGNLLEGVTANFWLAGGGEWRQIDLMPGSNGSISSEAHAGIYYVNAVDDTGTYLPAPAQQVVVEDNAEPTVTLTMIKTNASAVFTIENSDASRAATFNSFMNCWDETNQRGNGVEITRGAATLNLVAGTYTCTAVTPQNADASLAPIELTVAAGDVATEIASLVDHDTTLSGEILDQHGDVIEPSSDSARPLTVAIEGATYGHFAATVNDDGTWSQDLPPDNYTVKVGGDDVLPLVGDDSLTAVSLESGETKTDENLNALAPDSQITATIMEPDGKTPLAFAPVTCTYLPEGQKGDFSGGRVIAVTGETDENGAVQLDVLKKDGDQTLSYDCGVSVEQESGYIAPSLEAVQPGKDVDFTVAEPDKTLTVNYTTAADLSAVQCQAWSDDSTAMLTADDDDADGAVTFDVSKAAGTIWNVSCAGVSDDTWYTVAQPQTVELGKADDYDATVKLKENDTAVPDGMSQTFDSTGEKSLTVDGVDLTIPANSIESDDDVTLTVTPTATDLPKNDDNSTFGVPLNFQAFDSDGNVQNSFTEPIVVTIPYDQKAVKAAGLVETDLEPKYFDEAGGTWQTIPGYQINTADNTITFSTEHFTQFGLLYNTKTAGQAPPKVKQLHVPGKNLHAEQVKAVWKKMKTAASYDVQLLNKKGKTIKLFTGITKTSYVIVKQWLDPDTAYRVRVRSVGSNSLYSKWSQAKTFRTAAAY